MRQLDMFSSLQTMIRLTDLQLAPEVSFLRGRSAKAAAKSAAATATPFADSHHSGDVKALAAVFDDKSQRAVAVTSAAASADVESGSVTVSAPEPNGPGYFESFDSDSDDEDGFFSANNYREKAGGAVQMQSLGQSAAAKTFPPVSDGYHRMADDSGVTNRSGKAAKPLAVTAEGNKSNVRNSRRRRKSSLVALINDNLHLPLREHPPVMHSTYLQSSVIGERFAEHEDDAAFPRISFDHSENVVAWTYSRLVVQNFGERFRFRIDMYVGK